MILYVTPWSDGNKKKNKQRKHVVIKALRKARNLRLVAKFVQPDYDLEFLQPADLSYPSTILLIHSLTLLFSRFFIIPIFFILSVSLFTSRSINIIKSSSPNIEHYRIQVCTSFKNRDNYFYSSLSYYSTILYPFPPAYFLNLISNIFPSKPST